MVQSKYLTVSGILLSSLLTGCSWLPIFKSPEPRVVTETKYIKQNIPLQSKPRGLDPKNITWYVVTAENLDEFTKKVKQDNGALVFFAISVTDYERLSLNMADIKRYLEQQKQIIVYYEEAISAPLTDTGNGQLTK